jgi:hypothetical protein
MSPLEFCSGWRRWYHGHDCARQALLRGCQSRRLDTRFGSGTASQFARQQSFEPEVGPGAIDGPLTEVQPSLGAAAHERLLTFEAVARTAVRE